MSDFDRRLEEIRARVARLPALHAVEAPAPEWECLWPGEREDVRSEDGFTVSCDPTKDGWRTDSGHPAYTLPKQVAEDIATLRGDVAWLLESLEEACTR